MRPTPSEGWASRTRATSRAGSRTGRTPATRWRRRPRRRTRRPTDRRGRRAGAAERPAARRHGGAFRHARAPGALRALSLVPGQRALDGEDRPRVHDLTQVVARRRIEAAQDEGARPRPANVAAGCWSCHARYAAAPASPSTAPVNSWSKADRPVQNWTTTVTIARTRAQDRPRATKIPARTISPAIATATPNSATIATAASLNAVTAWRSASSTVRTMWIADAASASCSTAMT